jgi:Family of unknown function (DUF5906)/Bifunctional DNA primase/polymerase, N-terminal
MNVSPQWEATTDPTEHRLRLREAGFAPLPLSGKKALLNGWSTKHDTNPAEINLWGNLYPTWTNTGILTRLAPAIDIDIMNPEAAEAVEALARDRFEERGYFLVRIGRPPKRAILLRTLEPFKKLQAPLIAPGGDTEQKIEILGDGQQLVVAGIHPDTKRPYTWHGGEPGAIARDELPDISADEARAFLDDAVELLVREFGYDRVGRPRPDDGGGGGHGGGANWDQLVANIRAGISLHDSLRDLAAATIAKGLDEAGTTKLLRSMMLASTAPHDQRWRQRFDDIPKLVASAAGKFAKSISLDDFHAYMPQHSYIFAPTGEMWPANSVNARLPPQPLLKADGTPVLDKKGNPLMISANAWLDQHRSVEQMTWAPGEPELIKDRLISEGGWIERDGVACYNLYRPPTIKSGNAADAQPWLDHVRKVYPNDADHIILWLAHRVQHPKEKINHALVLGGHQGVGKDTLLEPVKQAVGPWNFSEVSPQQLLGRFNGFLRSVILRASEARDLGEINRFSFYDHLKAYTAAPPDVLRVDEKNLREHAVLNCCGVIITTNHKTDGIYLPADDRRHFVAWSDLTKDDFFPDYWKALWGWYENGGYEHVAAYLAGLDLTSFDAKAPPPKTPAFWEIVDANNASEEAEINDVLDRMGRPAATTLDHIKSAAMMSPAGADLTIWLNDRKNRKAIPHRLEKCGYVRVRNEDAADGLWRLNDKRQAIYAKDDLTPNDRLKAASRLAGGP